MANAAARVKKLREFRRNAGVIELRVWIQLEDREEILRLLSEYRGRAVSRLNRMRDEAYRWREIDGRMVQVAAQPFRAD